jgi:hypothetical protein
MMVAALRAAIKVKKQIIAMSEFENLTWDDLQPAFDLSYSVWDEEEKLAWAKKAWSILSKAKLTQYETGVERAEVIVRFLALTGIFADFYEIAFQDGFKPEYAELAEALYLAPLKVGQLIGRDADCDEGQDDSELYGDALRHLASEARDEVCRALITGFGNQPALFISLWRSNSYYADEVRVPDDDIVNNDLTPEKHIAYQWITEGCYPYGY